MTKHKRICRDCGVDALSNFNYYMVTDTLWKEFGVKEELICVSCLESRMGRRLGMKDLKMVPINLINPYTREIIEKESHYTYINGIKENHHE